MTKYEAFLLCRFPGETELRRYGFTSVSSCRNYLVFEDATVAPWPGISLVHKMSVAAHPTTYDDYCSRVGSLIEDLCVIYPPLCFTSGNGNVQYRSAIMDIINKFKNK